MKNCSVRLTRVLFSSLSFLALIFGLFFILNNFKTLPNEIGIHFNGSGQYDLVGSKWDVFFYYIIGAIIIICFELAQFAVSLLPIGVNVSQDGEEIVWIVARAFVGFVEFDICVFIAIIVCHISTQSVLNPILPAICAILLILSILAAITALIVVTKRFRVVCENRLSGHHTAKIFGRFLKN